MEQPNIKTTITDEKNNITYTIFGYRKLTEQEANLAVRRYLSDKKTKKPKQGQTVEIMTIIGFDQ